MPDVMCDVCFVNPRGRDTFACKPCSSAIKRQRASGNPRAGSNHRCFCVMCGTEYRHVVSQGGRFESCCSFQCRRRMHMNRFTFNIEPADFHRMWNEQAGMCAMPRCLVLLDMYACHIDHCHSTGVVRGLLCHGCNVRLGGYEKSLALGAAEYLASGG